MNAISNIGQHKGWTMSDGGSNKRSLGGIIYYSSSTVKKLVVSLPETLLKQSCIFFAA